MGSCNVLPLLVERLQAEVEQVAGGSRLPSAGLLSILNVETLGAEPLARWISFARQGSLSTQITRPRGYPERYLEPYKSRQVINLIFFINSG